MDAIFHWPTVRDKPAFLRRLMEELAGDHTRLSLEGDLSRCRFPDDLIVTRDELGLLTRNTLQPRQDFVVLRLTPHAVEPILRQMMSAGVKRAIIHIQIERNGVMELAVYDNFHPDCIATGPGISLEFLQDLRANHVLRSFRRVPTDQ